MPAITTTKGSSHPQACSAKKVAVSAKNISLDRNPLKSGTPAMEAAATMARVAV